MPPPRAWQALQAVALELEIVGPKERWIEDFKSEVGYVRRHWRDLQAAPPLEDCCLLPPRQTVLAGYALNLKYQHCLELRRRVELHHADDLDNALEEARCVEKVWCLINAATAEHNSWVCRRSALAALRELLGPEAYYSAARPAPVPMD